MGFETVSEAVQLLFFAITFIVYLIIRGPIATTLAISALIADLAGYVLDLVEPSQTSLILGYAGLIIDIPSGPSWQADGTIVYFSFVTLTSTGFGDVTPLHPIVRTLSNVEAIIGQLFPATLLARLITLELRGYRQRS
jgi:hypothetical protein